MCPLRVILLFLSALLAGYFAFKSVTSNSTKPGGGGVSDATDEVLQVGSADDSSLVEGGNQNACKKVSWFGRELCVFVSSGNFVSLFCFFSCFSSLLPCSLAVGFCIFFCSTLAVCKNCDSCSFEISKYERFSWDFLKPENSVLRLGDEPICRCPCTRTGFW
jgi:hypothetical protein